MDTTVLDGIRDLGLAALPLVTAWIGTHLRNQTLRDAADQAIERAGGIAYHYLASRVEGTNPMAARTQAIQEGVNYLQQMVPEILDKLGIISGAQLQNVVKGELGKLLATDPSVSVKVAPSGNLPLGWEPHSVQPGTSVGQAGAVAATKP